MTIVAAGLALAALPLSAAVAQRPPPSPEQRLDRLEKQVEQVQRQVFPKGRPADTAGFALDPAATQTAVASLAQRLDALERQLADIQRLAEENGHRMQTLQSDLAQVRADQEQRLSALEQKVSNAVLTTPPVTGSPAPLTPAPPTKAKPKPVDSAAVAAAEPGLALAADPGEEAYTEGFKLWEAGNYDQSITALRAFTSAYPKHRRVSYANNLVGRALLDKGEPRAAAEALLANYRNNPAGERAPDSLLYLGQALIKLGQPAQACKAYAELDAVYGAKVRPDLKKLEADAKTQAQCS